MRTFFSVMMAIAVASAQQTIEDFDENSPNMQVGLLGDGLDVAQPQHTDAIEKRRVPTGIDTDRYFEPAHSAMLGPVQRTATSQTDRNMRAHDAEFMHP